MSSRKKARLGEDKCMDGNTDTVCTTKSEPYPSITLDFGRPVDIAQVNSMSGGVDRNQISSCKYFGPNMLDLKCT